MCDPTGLYGPYFFGKKTDKNSDLSIMDVSAAQPPYPNQTGAAPLMNMNRHSTNNGLNAAQVLYPASELAPSSHVPAAPTGSAGQASKRPFVPQTRAVPGITMTSRC